MLLDIETAHYNSCRICVVCIAPSHPIVTDNFIEIESVQFRNESFDVSNNKVHGKRKSKFSMTKIFVIEVLYLN